MSLAGRPRHTAHGMSIGPVYTPPAFVARLRRRVCRRAQPEMLDASWEFCVLFTDLANPTSNSIYQMIGYRPYVILTNTCSSRPLC